MTRLLRRAATLLSLLLLVAFTASCADSGESIEEDTQLNKKLLEIQSNNGSAPLRDIAGGKWDRVYVFGGYVGRDDVEKAVGSDLDMEDFVPEHQHLFVFMKDKDIERAIYVSTPLTVQQEKYGPDVRIQAKATSTSTPPVLTLAEP